MQKKIIIVCSILILIAIIGFGTFSVITKEETMTNIITSGSINIAIKDLNAEGAKFSKTSYDILPGDEIIRSWSVVNKGAHPAYVRVSAEFFNSDENLTADGTFTANFNTTDWTYSDGYYYYNKALEAGMTTEPLFTKITVSGEEVDNDYRGTFFETDIVAYAVQAENNGDTVWDATGWPAKK